MMADKFGDLAQVNPAATTATTLYTASPNYPRGAHGTVVAVVNTSTATTFRIAVRIKAAVLATTHYKAYDVPLLANQVRSVYIGSLEATDIVTVYAGSANVNFTLNGIVYK